MFGVCHRKGTDNIICKGKVHSMSSGTINTFAAYFEIKTDIQNDHRLYILTFYAAFHFTF